MKKAVLFEKRRKARELKKKGWSNLRIARFLVANKDSIKKWLEMDEEELETDRRGCRPIVDSKYGERERERIIEIRHQLVYEPGARKGSRHIKERYWQLYGEEISEWFINKAIKQHRDRKPLNVKNKSIVSSFRLPSRIRKGKVVMSLEFVGNRHLKKPEESAFFLVCKYLEPYQLGVVSKVSERSGNEVLRVLRYTWSQYRTPDFVKMPYNSAFGANLVHAGCVGNLTLFLLNLGIAPFYVPVDRNFENIDLYDVEGIFSGEFSECLAMGRKRYDGLKIESFYLEYSGKMGHPADEMRIQYPLTESLSAEKLLKNRNVKAFSNPFIYFVQIVKGPAGMIRILSYEIDLDRKYIGHPVFCKLDLKKKTSNLFQFQ